MNRPRLAAQLYTVRQYTQTAKEFADTVHRLRVIGYTAVQISGIGPIPPAEVKAILDHAGLAVCNTHISYERLQNDLPAVIAEHRLWQCRHVALGSMPSVYRAAGEDGYRHFAREANEIGRRLAEAGLTFSYHNHSFEFVRFGKRTGLDVLFDESDPRYVQAEIDTYWVQHGGGDPAYWIHRMTGRMPVVHLKDMVIVDGKQEMAEVGEGNLNWPAIIEACRGAGVEWCAIEQDECRRHPLESLAISYANVRAMGLE
ncbi:MAG: sugar phosphate isomerase/epimerase [Anaerolineae bacterium]|nr:sugar phosphate isomerase/epimerase [Thermoflexales bacterium]MDW8407564.1 sugar phosphate isomerase/epimerase [Anaerolineae bacterium]